MNIAVISFTKNGADICGRLLRELAKSHSCAAYAPYRYCKFDGITPFDNSEKFMGAVFEKHNAVIFISAAGIAVRKIAPFIKSKEIDPAVICVDEKSLYCIPLLSGHIGGGNKLAEELAGILGAKEVITTATDLRGVFSVDSWAVRNGYHIENIGMVKTISAAILDNIKIGLETEYMIEGAVPPEIDSDNKPEYGISIFFDNNCFKTTGFIHSLRLTPKCISVGIGLRRGIDYEAMEEFFIEVLRSQNISINHIKCIASIDLKKDDETLRLLSEKYRLKFNTYTPEQLAAAEGDFTKSEFVERITGVDNVCERAAVIASENGALIAKKTVRDGMAIALAKKEWTVRF